MFVSARHMHRLHAFSAIGTSLSYCFEFRLQSDSVTRRGSDKDQPQKFVLIYICRLYFVLQSLTMKIFFGKMLINESSDDKHHKDSATAVHNHLKGSFFIKQPLSCYHLLTNGIRWVLQKLKKKYQIHFVRC